jgi:hypothetical protein
MNATATRAPHQRKPRQKPQRFIGRALRPGPDGTNGVVRIRVGKAQADYLLTPIPADFGRG